MGIPPELYGVTDFLEAFEIRRIGLSQEQFKTWLVGLWDIWKQRNNVLFGKEIRQPRTVVEFAAAFQLSFITSAERMALLSPPLSP